MATPPTFLTPECTAPAAIECLRSNLLPLLQLNTCLLCAHHLVTPVVRSIEASTDIDVIAEETTVKEHVQNKLVPDNCAIQVHTNLSPIK